MKDFIKAHSIEIAFVVMLGIVLGSIVGTAIANG